MAVEHENAAHDAEASASLGVSSAHRGWTTSQVAALAVTGLASSHTQPFVRLLYNDPRRHSNPATRESKPRILSLESGSGSSNDAACSRQRERDGKYTATWIFAGDHRRLEASGEVFNVPAAVDWVELQVWNRFASGFDVFLGKTTFSLHRLQGQSPQSVEHNGTNTSTTTAVASEARWLPLQASQNDSVRFQLSLQVACRFLRNSKELRIRDQLRYCKIRASASSKKAKDAKRSTFAPDPDVLEDSDADEKREEEDGVASSVVDPTFSFTRPNLPIEWAVVASTNLRYLFFHSDVERLTNFRELVLYGDLAQELEEDEDLQVDEDHLDAFSLCQYSAQYLDHCVESLSERLQEYRNQHSALSDSREHLVRKRRTLAARRKRLQKEHDELDMLVTTYQRVLEKNGSSSFPELVSTRSDLASIPTSPVSGMAAAPPPAETTGSTASSPTATLSSKKPVFLKTWEERERERRLEKELSKAQRIEDEKQRLQQRVLEREERDLFQARVAGLAERRKERAARRIHTFLWDAIQRLQDKRLAMANSAATRIQASWRRFMDVKHFPSRLERHKQTREMQLMATNELETRQWLAVLLQKEQEQEARETDKSNSHVDGTDRNAISDAECDSRSVSPSKDVADALAETWRRLHRVFVLAHAANGVDYRSLFSQLDLRKDDVIDRAEMRLGAQSFGVRMDRKFTRALITLLRTKCGAPSRPLLLTFEQFMNGFELPTRGATSPDRSVPGKWASHRIRKTLVRSGDGTAFPQDNHDDERGPYTNSSEDTLVLTVRALRSAIHEAARAHLETLGKSSGDYDAFRAALTDIFLAFDVDKDGQLDLDELTACMVSFGLRIDDANTELLRELFSIDQSDGVVRVSEFISFVLAHTSVSRRRGDDDSELGVMGYRLRNAILDRVTLMQDHPDSVEEAVRCVFRAAYKRPGQRRCSVRDFIQVLESLNLGLARAQLARLIMRLDRDGDRYISFDELLIWLRVQPALEDSTTDNDAALTAPALLKAKAEAELIYFLLASLVVGDLPDGQIPTSTFVPVDPLQWAALFHRIGRKNSSKIHHDEVQMFLEAQDLPKLRTAANQIASEDVTAKVFGPASSPQAAASTIAQNVMALLDVNGNGVVTLEEWLEFAQHADGNTGDAHALVEPIRSALKASENDDPTRVLRWFNSLPGTMPLPTPTSTGSPNVKIRTGEFKNALRRKLSGARSVPLHVINQIVKILDVDGSGWITTREFHVWAFPTRDLEEILRLVIKGWQNVRHKLVSGDNHDNFAASLHQRFDADSNGCLAMGELRRGFESFGTVLTDDEVRVLLLAFDLDGDGCWSKAEFETFVNKLFPTEVFNAKQPPQAGLTGLPVSDTGNLEHASGNEGDAGMTFDPDGYDDQDLELLAASPLSSSSDLTSLSEAREGESGLAPVEYSEDFDDDG